jgi:hypothetical protein
MDLRPDGLRSIFSWLPISDKAMADPTFFNVIAVADPPMGSSTACERKT